MKKTYLLIAAALAAFTSCSSDKDNNPVEEQTWTVQDQKNTLKSIA